MDDYERVLLVKPDVNVYRIPPRTTNRAYRASDWNLDSPDWVCRLRLLAKGTECYIKLDEKSTGQFFGQCPIDKYPSTAIESVSDSSRYFVLKLVNEQTKRTAFLGIGFTDRSESFDLNVALQDHFKIVQMEQNPTSEADQGPKLDLGFKEGQTIKVNLNIGKKATTAKPRPKASGTGLGVLLPPPPGSSKLPASSASAASSTSQPSNFHQQLLSGLESLSLSPDDNSKHSTLGSLPPTLTPANSICTSDGLGSASPGRSPAKLDKDSFSFDLLGGNSTGGGGGGVPTKPDTAKKSDQDLWSDFEDFNTLGSSTADTTAPAKEATSSSSSKPTVASSFDDWATF